MRNGPTRWRRSVAKPLEKLLPRAVWLEERRVMLGQEVENREAVWQLMLLGEVSPEPE
jgi:hypothetical protein